jgi:hypothetical protein
VHPDEIIEYEVKRQRVQMVLDLRGVSSISPVAILATLSRRQPYRRDVSGLLVLLGFATSSISRQSLSRDIAMRRARVKAINFQTETLPKFPLPNKA